MMRPVGFALGCLGGCALVALFAASIEHDRRAASITRQQARTIEQQQHQIERLQHLQQEPATVWGGPEADR